MFFKILTLSAIQNHIREAFMTLESFGLSQFYEDEMQKSGLHLYRIDPGGFLLWKDRSFVQEEG